MNLFLFMFILIILITFYLVIKNYGMTEQFLSDFSIDDLKSVEYDPIKNVFISKRFRDFWDCSVGRKPMPIKSNFVNNFDEGSFKSTLAKNKIIEISNQILNSNLIDNQINSNNAEVVKKKIMELSNQLLKEDSKFT